ncbi:tRNA (adenosine(37)-N6)-threonylcarbamoyltransferase complex dimerization subunit type 1 TsaB [Planobispora siamensis]|uniref:tRNA (Adenosine(37)-N6)-threonylcarbamoyltransferase complex dimerization subunit type 1 TsaB n=1 Tax=Planobispora siamensis TaxID=936338 RepID=A0A8J3SB42_9ACTN|nr:tRNA (adenosine(37)-N6)-threonylcarbamoyltransferase complex dimerization subunit type 1 TsaB [Planobispora siamensis]
MTTVLVLAFDTATPAVTAALHDGRRVLAESTTVDARRHGELLAPTIERVLAESGAALRDVTAIAVGSGPGPYTGLRVGLMTAQALSTTLGVPAYGVCTLDALAYGTGLSEPFLVATDARRKEVFWGHYADARTRLSGPAVDKPQDLPADLPLAGAGARMYAEIVGASRLLDVPELPSAGALAALAASRLDDADLREVVESGAHPVLGLPRPIYLRRPDAQVPAPPKKVSR